MGVYFVLVEDCLGVRPPHGFIVCGDGSRHKVENTTELQAWVLDLAKQIRAARVKVSQPIPVNPKPGQCRPCGNGGIASRPDHEENRERQTAGFGTERAS
jgi:CRISPR-associated exonuclease Cas4